MKRARPATEQGSPILINLDRGGFRLTDLAAGVRFDLDRDGVTETLFWTEPGNGDGWLIGEVPEQLAAVVDGSVAVAVERQSDLGRLPPEAT